MKKKPKEVKPGMFVNIQWEYGDVWHEVSHVYGEHACSIYIPIDGNSQEVKTDYTFSNKIDNVRKKLPKNVRCAFLRAGAYSERRDNLALIPNEYFKNKTN